MSQCQICHAQEARYKCPKCLVAYCSIVCFKSPTHTHEKEEKDNEEEMQKGRANENGRDIELGQKEAEASKSGPEVLFERIANDHIIKSLLSYKSLRAHLSVLLKLLLDSSITKEPMFENRKEIANMRLCELRIGGAEENELVEEFVQRVLFLQDEA